MSMADRDGKIWKDGKLIDWRDATVHVLTHSLHYGMAVFEGVRAYKTQDGTAIFRLREHTQRLFNSAKIFQMKIPFDMETMMEAQKQVVRENSLESCYLRPLVWIGDEKLGVSAKGNTIHVAIAAWPWGAYLGEDGMSQGIRVKISSFTRHHVNVSLVRAKASGYYINSILANQEALADGYDEALLLDTDGYVSEGSGENVFIVKNGKLYTPDLASCLDGITRDSVMHDGARPRHRGDRKAHHARRNVLLRRSLLHRHRSRSHADPRTRQPPDRRRPPRPDHRKTADAVLRRRCWPRAAIPSLADGS